MDNKYTDDQIILGFLESVDRNFSLVYATLNNDFNKVCQINTISNVIDSISKIVMKDTKDQLLIKRPDIQKKLGYRIESYLQGKLNGTPLGVSLNTLNADLTVSIKPYEYKPVFKPVGIVKYQNSVIIEINVSNRSKVITPVKTI